MNICLCVYVYVHAVVYVHILLQEEKRKTKKGGYGYTRYILKHTSRYVSVWIRFGLGLGSELTPTVTLT